VNFYTLTFKQRVITALLSIVVLIIALNIVLSLFIDIKTTKNSFINEKYSKIKHFNLNNPKNKDIIFIGSSKTFFHISTNLFKEKNIDIYNMGISGVFFTDYPTLVDAVLDAKPKRVVISLGIERLYSELFISKYPSIEEISIYYGINKGKFIQSLYRWLINRNTFLVHSEPIFLRIKTLYSKFEIEKDFKKFKSKKSINYSTLAKCKVFDIKRTNSKHAMLKCSNGDGVLVGHYIKKLEYKSPKPLNKESILYLKATIKMLQSHNIETTIIFEPQLKNNLKYNINDIYREFAGVDIIDLTNFPIQEKFWADNKHLNYKGREIYSDYLSTLFMPIGDNNNK